MGVITISRGSYSKGKEIAEKLAENLGYTCISRDIILETSEHFNIPEIKLVRAIHDAPSILDRVNYKKEKYIAYFYETLLEHCLEDNIVYHGLAGHFVLQKVPHIMKTRIIANLEDRVKEEMKRENISAKQAKDLLLKDDQERHKWSRHLYGIDTFDPSLYDIVLHIDNLSVEDAVEILSEAARRPCFQTTPESQDVLQDEYLAARVKVALIDAYPNARVECSKRSITVTIASSLSLSEKIRGKIEEITASFKEIRAININITPVDID